MRRLFFMALMAALAAGCGDLREKFGMKPASPTAPQPAASAFPSGGQTPGEEVNPSLAPRPTVARVAEKPGAAAPDSPTQPTRKAHYEARLENVPLPLPKERPPLLAEADGKPGLPPLVNTVLAEVNGEVITREDILGPMRPQMEQWRKNYSKEAFESRCRDVIDMRLRQAISRRLVVQEANAQLTDKEKQEVDASLAQAVKEMTAQAGSMAQLEEKLKVDGSSIEDEKIKERERMIVQRYLREKIAPTIHITHSELLGYYNQVREERYVQPTRLRLGLVMLKKSESGDAAQARALAQAVHERAVAGEDFGKLAARYSRDAMASKGGDWGAMTQGSFRVRAVDEALFALQAGQVAAIVEESDAYYIVKALERQDGRTVPFTEVQDKLEDELRDKKYNETVSKYIQGLYERAYVRVNMENL